MHVAPVKLSSILAKVREADAPATDKTAAAAPAADPIASALREVQGRDKTAGVDPLEQLKKLAAETAAVENEADIKLARLQGAAFVDGMMARLDAYESAAGETEKQAAAKEAAEVAALEKYAKEDPAGFKADVEAGYSAEMERLAKEAQSVYAASEQETLEWVQKTAALHYLEGRRAIEAALTEAAA